MSSSSVRFTLPGSHEEDEKPKPVATSSNSSKSPFTPIRLMKAPTAPEPDIKLGKWDCNASLLLEVNKRAKSWKSISKILSIIVDEYSGADAWRSLNETIYWMLARNLELLPKRDDRYEYMSEFHNLVSIQHSIYYIFDHSQNTIFNYRGKIQDIDYVIKFSCDFKHTRRNCPSFERFLVYKSKTFKEVPELYNVLIKEQVNVKMIENRITPY